MRDRLLYAISMCKEIDSDFVVPDQSEMTIQYDSDSEGED